MAAPRTPEDRMFRRVVKNNEIKKGNTPIMKQRMSPRINVPKATIEEEARLMGDYQLKLNNP